MNRLLLLIGLTITLLMACHKDEDTTINTNPSVTPTPSTQDGFVWKEDGGAEIKADSAFWTTWGNGTGIRAYKNGMNNFYEINWGGANNTSVGNKALTAGQGFTFLKGSDTYSNSSAVDIVITAFNNDKLSGNFNVSVSGGSIQNLSATFINLPKK